MFGVPQDPILVSLVFSLYMLLFSTIFPNMVLDSIAMQMTQLYVSAKPDTNLTLKECIKHFRH